MRRPKPTGKTRRGGVIATRLVSGDDGLVEIVTLSLAGLACALFQIAHYTGTAALQQMFAP